MMLLDRDASDNILLGRVEFGDEDILKAMAWSVDQYNLTRPLDVEPVYTVNTIPDTRKPIILLWTSAWLLRSAAIRYQRNQLSGGIDGGTTIDDQDKSPAYLTLSRLLSEEARELTINVKVAININQGWGNVGGTYS